MAYESCFIYTYMCLYMDFWVGREIVYKESLSGINSFEDPGTKKHQVKKELCINRTTLIEVWSNL